MIRENATSPVIGAMLLLTLVIIFAAVLSAFAGGLVGTVSPPPSVELSAGTSGTGEDFHLVFEHRGGDILSVADGKITTFVDSHEGRIMVSDLTVYNWRPGDILSTKNLTVTAGFLGISPALLKEHLSRSVPIELRIYHTPTNSILLKTTILLEEHL